MLLYGLGAKSKGRETNIHRQSKPNIFLWIDASVADAAALNSNGIRMLLSNSLSTFFIEGKPVFSNGPNSLPRNPPNCPIFMQLSSDNVVQ